MKKCFCLNVHGIIIGTTVIFLNVHGSIKEHPVSFQMFTKILQEHPVSFKCSRKYYRNILYLFKCSQKYYKNTVYHLNVHGSITGTSCLLLHNSQVMFPAQKKNIYSYTEEKLTKETVS
jgi:hypothetical protein